MTHDVTDFDAQVLDASHETPILVDFWAPWCGPCRTLGPVLEKLDAEAGGKWKLAKVNTDQYPEISQRFGIRGIPAVKMFVGGEVVDEFTGALPEYAVLQWLEKALPSAAKDLTGLAEANLIAGDRKGAQTALESALEEQPTNPNASALLASLLVFQDPERGAELAAVGMSGEARYVQVAEAVKTLAEIISVAVDQMPDGPAKTLADGALASVRAGEFGASVDQLLEILQSDRYYNDDFARKMGVALFTVLGPEHPVTRAKRRTFDMWLY